MALVSAWLGLLIGAAQTAAASATNAPSASAAPAAAPQAVPAAPVAAPRSQSMGPLSIRIGGSSLFARPRVASPAQRRGTPAGSATYVAPTAAASAAPPGAGALPLALMAGASTGLAGAASPTSRLPAVVLQALDRGPISEREAELLVELLLSSNAGGPFGSAGGEAAGATRLLDQPVDPDLQQVAELLDGGAADGAAAPLDATRLRAWYARLDLSRDAAVSFLEWRDVTAAPLDLFRALDESRDGLLRFDEFARALLLNTAREGVRPIDPELFAWARATLRADEPLSPIDPAELEGLDDAAILARARAALAAEAARKALAAPPAKAPVKPRGG